MQRGHHARTYPVPMRPYALFCLLLVFAGCADAPPPDDAPNEVRAEAAPAPDPFSEDSASLDPNAAPDAPSVEVGTLGGGRFSLEEQRGKVVLVQFWTTWSEPARAHLDALGSALRVMGTAASALVVAADAEGAEAVAPIMAESGLRVPTTLDAAGSLSRAFGGVRMYPTTFVVDAEGRLRARHVGALTEAGLLELAGPYLIERADPPLAAVPLPTSDDREVPGDRARPS